MIYILDSEDRISGVDNNFKIQLTNNHLINKDKEYYIYLKSIIPINCPGNRYLELTIKGIGSSILYDSNNGFSNNVLKYHLHSSSDKTIYYPKYKLNSLELSNIDIELYDITNDENPNIDRLLIVFELQEIN